MMRRQRALAPLVDHDGGIFFIKWLASDGLIGEWVEGWNGAAWWVESWGWGGNKADWWRSVSGTCEAAR